MGFLEESKDRIKKYSSKKKKSSDAKTEAEQKIEEIYKVYKNYTKEITSNSKSITDS
jgi:cytochrome oxidase Cu insertion factor (SCO1/SenC/PrrC family)